MKRFKFTGMAALAIMLCVTFIACSDDDDNDTKNNNNASSSILAKTTWKVISSPYEELNEIIFTFTEKGEVNTNDPYWDKPGGYTYLIEGDYLTIDLKYHGRLVGIISINGNTATYTYDWWYNDSDWEWNGKEAILEKLEYDEKPEVRWDWK